MTNVVDLKLAPKEDDVAPGIVLLSAQAAELEIVIVIGRNKNHQFYLKSSDSEIGENLLLIEIARQELVEQARD